MRVKLWLRRIGVGFVVLLVVLAVGRQVQVAWESRIVGARAPYLQMLGSDRVTIRWQSEEPERGELRFGFAPEALEWTLEESEPVSRHAVTLSGLEPATRYYYAIGTMSGHFTTAPEAGVDVPLRLWIQGDPGYATAAALKARDAALGWMDKRRRPGRPLFDLWMTTGDNAYRSGSNAQFEKHLFSPYRELLANNAYWPSYGNHDDRRRAFFELFDFPTAGELGGEPSGSEHYYSIDHGPLHLIFLDSQSESLSATGEMAQWLERDLAANTQRWSIVAIHHPPYTKGSHDSDSWRDSWGRMVEVRENILPIIERHGVDLVLSGHSHMYERSHLIACHYGDSASFEPGMVVDGESPYVKGEDGTLYAVVGSSAKLDHGPLNHPANAVGLKKRGSLLVDIQGAQLTGRFIDDAGKVADRFVITKHAEGPTRRCD